MLAEEMALMLFVSPDGASFLFKMGTKFAKKVGTVAAKMSKGKLPVPVLKKAGISSQFSNFML